MVKRANPDGGTTEVKARHAGTVGRRWLKETRVPWANMMKLHVID